jgi:hypothetical protein
VRRRAAVGRAPPDHRHVTLDDPARGAGLAGDRLAAAVEDDHAVGQVALRALDLVGEHRERWRRVVGDHVVEVPQHRRRVVEDGQAMGDAIGAQRRALPQGAVEGDDPRVQLGVGGATRRRRRPCGG